MITETELKKAVIDLLKEAYPAPKYRYYGIEVSEGYQRPAFFVDLRLRSRNDETANIISKMYDVTITHFPKRIKETVYTAMIDDIAALLMQKDTRKRKPRMTLKVGDRYIKVEDYAYDYAGKNNNLLQIEWSMTFCDFAEEGPSEYQTMNYMDLSEE